MPLLATMLATKVFLIRRPCAIVVGASGRTSTGVIQEVGNGTGGGRGGVVLRTIRPWSTGSTLQHPCALHTMMMSQQQRQQQQQRGIQSSNSGGGPMVEADFVEPEGKQLLEKFLQDHQQLIANPTTTNEEMFESLKQIAKQYHAVKDFEACLATMQELVRVAPHLQDIARAHCTMGDLHQKLSNFKAARADYEKSIAYFQQDHRDTFHSQVGTVWLCLCEVAMVEVELGQAMEYLNRAEEHFRYDGQNMYGVIIGEDDERYPGPHHGLKDVLEAQAKVKYEQGLHVEALRFYRESERLFGIDKELKMKIGDTLLPMMKLNEAQEMFVEALEETDNDSIVGAYLHHQLGTVDYHKGEMDNALTHFEIAHKLRTKHLGDTHPLVGKTATILGATLAHLEQPGPAMSHFREALIIARIHTEFEKDEDDPVVKLIMKNIHKVQQSMERSTFSMDD